MESFFWWPCKDASLCIHICIWELDFLIIFFRVTAPSGNTSRCSLFIISPAFPPALSHWDRDGKNGSRPDEQGEMQCGEKLREEPGTRVPGAGEQLEEMQEGRDWSHEQRDLQKYKI